MKEILMTCLTLITATAAIAQPESTLVQVTMENTTSPMSNVVESAAEEVIVLKDDLLVFGGEADKSVSVGIGTTYPSSLASLELGDKDKGLLINRMTDQELIIFEMALGIAEEGMMVYNIDRGNIVLWNGTRWIPTGLAKISLDEDLLIVNDELAVDLSTYKDNTDQQNLTSATLEGKTLTIAIENGADVSVDLSPIFEQFEERIAALEKAAGIQLDDETVQGSTRSKAILYQNAPNPIQYTSSIKYMVPETAKSAKLMITNSMGKTLVTKELKPNGLIGNETFNASNLASGVYYCTLIVDGNKIDTKKMVVD